MARDFNNAHGQYNYNKRPSRDENQSQQSLDITDEAGNVLNFKSSWITDEADQDMINYAEAAGKKLKKEEFTTSQIRNIFGEIRRIQSGGYTKNKASFLLLQPKVAYLVGRNNKILGIKIFRDIFEKAAKSVSDEKSYQNFCNLMEAIVAYHKFNGGE